MREGQEEFWGPGIKDSSVVEGVEVTSQRESPPIEEQKDESNSIPRSLRSSRLVT